MSAGFTPGPWKVDYGDKRGGNIIARSGPVANTRWFGNSHKEVMEDHVNARLIAEAPDLYDALEGAVQSLRWWEKHEPQSFGNIERNRLEAAEECLARVRGEA